MNQFMKTVCAAGIALAASLPSAAQAATIDMEGIAAINTQTTDDGTTRTFNGFNLFLPHGHYQGLGFDQPISRPSNGSDWLVFDHFAGTFNQAFVVTEVGGNAFSIQRIDVSEWRDDLTPATVLTVTGLFQGGGTITTTFTTDRVFGFETFTFSPAWTNLVSVQFVDLNPDAGFGKPGFDDIVVNEAAAAVPEPATLALVGLGLSAAVRSRRRRQ